MVRGQPDYENFGLALASDTEAYGGRLGKARELTKQAWTPPSGGQQGKRGNLAGECRHAGSGLRQSCGSSSAAEALKLAPTSQGVEIEAALAFAMAGDTAQAESVAQDLEKRFPLDTQMQSLWLPAIRAQLALDRKNRLPP